MNYRVEWMGGAVAYGLVVLLLLVPEFAVIAVLTVVSAALVALVALAAAVLASPYLLLRGLHRRLAESSLRRPPRRIHAPSASRGL